jgi:hypothetical protein
MDSDLTDANTAEPDGRADLEPLTDSKKARVSTSVERSNQPCLPQGEDADHGECGCADDKETDLK